eukprot:993723-Rhodomonas_salina.1
MVLSFTPVGGKDNGASSAERKQIQLKLTWPQEWQQPRAEREEEPGSFHAHCARLRGCRCSCRSRGTLHAA